MLHATYVRGKSNRYKVYQGYRDEQTPHVHEEDEITSTILGPLDFLSPAAVHRFWRAVLAKEGVENLLPEEAPDQSSVTFWDSRRASLGGLRIEPDGRFDFFWQSSEPRQCTLLLEVKWRAPLSGEDQLHRQWSDYLSDKERRQTFHIFLGIETSAGFAAQRSSRGDVWKKRLVLITWSQVRAALAELSRVNDELGRWAQMADCFLERVGIRSFLGFDQFEHEHWAIAAQVAPLFWQPFSCWDWASKPMCQTVHREGVIFWLGN